MLIFPNKDPDEVLDYRIDWSARTAGDAIVASVWSLVDAAGLIINSDSHDTNSTTVWLSGGVDGAVGLLQNTVTTSGGRTLEETAAISIGSVVYPTTPGYDLPTATYIRAAFAAFNGVPDATIDFWISRAARSVDTSWTQGDYTYAIALLAAHLMTGAGLGTGTDAELAAAGLTGVSRLKSGTLDVSFAGGGAGSGDASGYGSTAYGRQFLALLKQNKGGPRVIANGGYCQSGWAKDVPWFWNGVFR